MKELKEVQIQDSLGDLVNTVNAMLRTVQDSESTVGNIEELPTINSDSVVSAITEVYWEVSNLVGDKTYFQNRAISAHIKELKERLGDFNRYDYLRGTNLLAILDDIVKLMENSTGEYTDIAERLNAIDVKLSERSHERMVSVADFGVVSNSNIDQTDEILEAMNHASSMGTMVVYFPPGTYALRPLSLRSDNFVIKGAGRRTVFRHANNSASALFNFRGDLETTHQYSTGDAGNFLKGENTIPYVGGSATMNVGDKIRLVGGADLSELDAVQSGDIALEHEMVTSDETGGKRSVYYSEFNSVKSLLGTDGYELSSPVASGAFRSGGSSRNMGARMQRVTLRQGSRLENVSYDAVGARGNKLFLASYTQNFTAENVFITTDGMSNPIDIHDSIDAVVKDVVVDYETAYPESTAITVEASERITIKDSRINGAGIGVEVKSRTFDEDGNPIGATGGYGMSRNVTVRDTEITNAIYSGVYEDATNSTSVRGCHITGAQNMGIFVTGRYTLISDNHIDLGWSEYTKNDRTPVEAPNGRFTVGSEVSCVVLHGRGSRNAVINGNSFMNASQGVREICEDNLYKMVSDNVISANTFLDCERGVNSTNRHEQSGPDWVNDNFYNLTIIGNTFNNSVRNHTPVRISYYVNGFKIIGNSFNGHNRADRCISLAMHFDYGIITGNSAIGFQHFNPVYVASRSTNKNAHLLIENNHGQIKTSDAHSSRIDNVPEKFNRSLVPYFDNFFDIGTSAERFRDVYLRNAPSVSSDRDEKEDIEQEVLGMKFVNMLNPVSYRLKDNQSGRKHHGLIAQEVEDALRAHGVSNQDHGGLVIGDDGRYSLRYEEMISHLILGMKEMYREIEQLKGKNTQSDGEDEQ